MQWQSLDAMYMHDELHTAYHDFGKFLLGFVDPSHIVKLDGLLGDAAVVPAPRPTLRKLQGKAVEGGDEEAHVKAIHLADGVVCQHVRRTRTMMLRKRLLRLSTAVNCTLFLTSVS